MIDEQEAAQTVTISCDRSSHAYHVGEPVTFTINGASGTSVDLELSRDGGTVLKTCQLTLPAMITSTLPQPGFLRCTVTPKEGDRKPVLCAVACDPEDIRPAACEPEDFDDFWHKASQQFERIPEDLTLRHHPELDTDSASFHELTCSNWNGETLYGFLRLPKQKEPAPLLVYFEGAGPGQCLQTFQLHGQNVDRHIGKHVAALTICTHNFKPGDTQEQHLKRYEDHEKRLGGNYWLEGFQETITQTFFYRMILGARRLCNLVSKLPQINPRRIAYLGASQGGGFGLYITAGCPQIKAAFCGVPAFGDFQGAVIGNHQPQSNTTNFKKFADKLDYVDAAFFARRIKVPVFISLGYVDTSCPPTSVMAIANSLGGPKLVYHKVSHGHGDGPVDYENLTWFWIKQYLDND